MARAILVAVVLTVVYRAIVEGRALIHMKREIDGDKVVEFVQGVREHPEERAALTCLAKATNYQNWYLN